MDKVNRELARLDSELRAGGIDRASFRAQRRRLLLDFEERETTTQPTAPTPTGSETTLVDPEAEPLLESARPEPSPPPSRTEPVTTSAKADKNPVAGIALYAIGAIVVLALAGWWVARPKSDAPASLHSAPTAAGTVPTAPIAGAHTPQSLATTLTESEWTGADLAEFLTRWRQLPPESIQAATEDSRIWLLRGETGRRLRDAREMESLEPSIELRARIEQLEAVQAAVGTP